MPRTQRDNNGNLWVCVGPVRETRTKADAFHPDEVANVPAAERHYSASEAYAETVHAGGCFDRIIADVKRRNAQRVYAVLQEHGCTFRVDGETLFVGPRDKVDEDSRKLIGLLKGELIELVSSEAAVSQFDSETLVPAGK
jgi:hypothetical protein